MSAKPTSFENRPTSKALRFLDQVSPEYLESLQEQYETDPQSVPQDWQFFFEILKLAENQPGRTQVAAEGSSEITDELRVMNMISAFRQRGHLLAQIDPLGMRKPPFDPHLDLNYFGLGSIEAGRTFQAARELNMEPSTLNQISEALKSTYCGSIGVEFHYIRDETIYNWLKARIDKNRNRSQFTKDQKLSILKNLGHANSFENFLQTAYMGQKRFSVEGGEAVIPAIHRCIELSADLGAEEVLIGMAHRGRLNVLVNVMQKPFAELFKEFEGAELPSFANATGDVKYHQGYSSDVTTNAGKKVHLSLAPNPSHLEFVDPVVEGMARAKIEKRYNNESAKLMPILIHGDAAVIGQGIVAETLNLSQLKGYKTGGTLHIVINNQVGFTTSPEDSRSSLYCTDFGKGFQCPIFHVNGNDPEAVVHAIELATEYRMTFQKDVFVDIVCYRKYGHNEGDEPRFTQPVMYDVIGKQKNPYELYREQCSSSGAISSDESSTLMGAYQKKLEAAREQVKGMKRVLEVETLHGAWTGFRVASHEDLVKDFDTSIPQKAFDLVIKTIHEIPEKLNLMPKFRKMFETRLKKISEQNEIDWAVGEQLGFGSLLLDGMDIRISGQDAIRGTFSHRHSALTDSQTTEKHWPLRHLASKQGAFQVFDSPLSEAAVMGFDYGYSLAHPKALVCWEGQFGDFANGAQVIIDQFLVSAETKWYRMSGLVLLLPHGYEGQGPEHSSARLERFLQLCGQDNIQVCYPTTPAQIAHLLRRQVMRDFRKPLVVMTPKSLLRHPEAVSAPQDFLKGGFKNIIVNEVKNPQKVILCSGKVYYDLKKRSEDLKISDKIVLIRIEQLYPLDKSRLSSLYRTYEKLPWVWCQEEPRNMGAWTHMKMSFLDEGWSLTYAGRPESASPATGSSIQHQRELEEFLAAALKL
jgi:2-oxoglutarate dehydrogenase E1 component